jgi:hypothetical protein
MSSIDNIKSTIRKHGGIAPNNRYNVIFTPPEQSLLNLDVQSVVSSLLSGGFSASSLINDPRDISLLCQSVQMPGRNIATFDHQDFQQSNKFPYTVIDSEVTMEFLVTNDYYIRKMFDNWMNGIYNTNTHRIGLKENYSVDCVIQHLNQENIPIHGVKLLKAFPTDISAMELSQEDSALVKMTVTWAYDKFEPEGAVESALSGISSALEIFN